MSSNCIFYNFIEFLNSREYIPPMKTLSLLGLYLTLLSLTSCGFNPAKSLLRFTEAQKEIINPIKTETETETDKKYLAFRDTLFTASCTKCHNANTKKRMDLTKKDIIIENYDDILSRMTDAFDMGFDYMPPEGDKVSPALIEEFKSWKAGLEVVKPTPVEEIPPQETTPVETTPVETTPNNPEAIKPTDPWL